MLNILGLARLQSGRTCKLKPWHFENNASPCLVPSKPVSNQCPQNFAQCTWVANAKKRLSTSSSSFKKPQLIQQKNSEASKLNHTAGGNHNEGTQKSLLPRNSWKCSDLGPSGDLWSEALKGPSNKPTGRCGMINTPKKCSNMFLQAISSTGSSLLISST